MEALSQQDLLKIRNGLLTYKKCAQATSIPWQMLGSVHFRESCCSTKDGNPMQFDPKLSSQQIYDLLIHFSSLHETQVVDYSHKSVGDLETACMCAGAFLVRKCLYRLSTDHSDEAVKDAFYSYNGRAYGSVDKSPYVMNGFDAQHSNMHLRGTNPDPNHPGQRIQIDVIDHRPGTFTIYKQLQGLKW